MTIFITFLTSTYTSPCVRTIVQVACSLFKQTYSTQQVSVDLSVRLSLCLSFCLYIHPPTHPSTQALIQSFPHQHTQLGVSHFHDYPYPTALPVSGIPSCERRKAHGHTSSTKDIPPLILYKCHISQNLNTAGTTPSIAL